MGDEVKGPAPAQTVSAESAQSYWQTWCKENLGIVRRAILQGLPALYAEFAEAFAAQQNAALREELERAKKDLADSRLNHIDANQRNIQAVARAEAAEVELANVKQQLEIAKAGLAALAALEGD